MMTSDPLGGAELAAYGVVGGFFLYVFAVWFLGRDVSTSRDAVTYGLSWPALFKGIGESLYAAGKARGG